MNDTLAVDFLAEHNQGQANGPTSTSLTKKIWALLLLPAGSDLKSNNLAKQKDRNLSNVQYIADTTITKETDAFINDAFNWMSGDASTFLKKAEVDKKVSIFTKYSAAASLAAHSARFYQSASSSPEFSKTLAAPSYSALLKDGDTSTMKFCAIAALLRSESPTQVKAALDQQDKEDINNALIAFNEKLQPQHERHWYEQLRRLYDQAKGRQNSAALFEKGINDLLTARGQRFFNAPAEYQAKAYQAAGLKFPASAESLQNSGVQENCLAQYRARLVRQLQPVFARLCERIAYESNCDKANALQDWRGLLRDRLDISIFETGPANQESAFAFGTYVLRSHHQISLKEYRIDADKYGTGELVCSLLDYMQYGLPTKIEAYEYKRSKPTVTKEFRVKTPNTKIFLSASDPQ